MTVFVRLATLSGLLSGLSVVMLCTSLIVYVYVGPFPSLLNVMPPLGKSLDSSLYPSSSYFWIVAFGL